MSAPTSTCSFICSNSASVSLPGLLRMCSGTASLPVSCSSAAASIALSVSSSATPSSAPAPSRTPARAARDCASRRPWRRSPSPASRRSTDTGDPCRRDAVRRPRAGRTTPQREVEHHQQRQDDGHGRRGSTCWMSRMRQNATERRREIAERQPQEVLAPDLERRLPRVEADRHGGEPGIERRNRSAVSASSGTISGAHRRVRAARAARRPRAQKNACAAGPHRQRGARRVEGDRAPGCAPPQRAR